MPVIWILTCVCWFYAIENAGHSNMARISVVRYTCLGLYTRDLLVCKLYASCMPYAMCVHRMPAWRSQDEIAIRLTFLVMQSITSLAPCKNWQGLSRDLRGPLRPAKHTDGQGKMPPPWLTPISWRVLHQAKLLHLAPRYPPPALGHIAPARSLHEPSDSPMAATDFNQGSSTHRQTQSVARNLSLLLEPVPSHPQPLQKNSIRLSIRAYTPNRALYVLAQSSPAHTSPGESLLMPPLSPFRLIVSVYVESVWANVSVQMSVCLCKCNQAPHFPSYPLLYNPPEVEISTDSLALQKEKGKISAYY